MRSSSRWALLTLVAAMAAVLAGCAQQGAERRSAPAGALVPPVVPVTAQGIRALAARPGARATLVNVWGTWCVPCREEFPALLRVARAHRREGLRLVLVSADFDEQLPAVHQFLAANGVTDTTYLKTGDDMAFINTLSPRWSGALPATFVYDGEGRLAAFWEGMADEGRFQRAVGQALAAHAPEEETR